MARIYLVRHGESVANTKGIYQGQTYDTGLSVMGKKQARALANYFANIKVDKIFVSPLLRTKQTARAVAQSKQINIFETRKLIETNHGHWEGLEKNIISDRWSELYRLWLTKPSEVRFPGGETFLKTKKRVIDWWGRIIDMDEDTLIVTHDNIIRIIIAEVLGLGLDNIWRFQLSPAAVTVIGIEKGDCRLLVLDEKYHLKKILSNLGSHAL